MRTQSDLGTVLCHISPLIAHTKLKTSRNVSRAVIWYFYYLDTPYTFDLCLARKKERKKEDEQNQNFCLVFSTSLKASRTDMVDVVLE